MFRQEIWKPDGATGFSRASVGLSPGSRLVDIAGAAPPYAWVQQQVLGNGTLAAQCVAQGMARAPGVRAVWGWRF